MKLGQEGDLAAKGRKKTFCGDSKKKKGSRNNTQL